MEPVSTDRTLSSLVWEGGWGWLSKQTTTTNNLIREAPVLKQFKQNYFPFLSQCQHILRCHLLKTHSWNLWGVGALSRSACQTAPDSLLASVVGHLLCKLSSERPWGVGSEARVQTSHCSHAGLSNTGNKKGTLVSCVFHTPLPENTWFTISVKMHWWTLRGK